MRRFLLARETVEEMISRFLSEEIAREIIGKIAADLADAIIHPREAREAWDEIGQMAGWTLTEDAPRAKHEKQAPVTYYYAEADETVSDDDFYLMKLKWQRPK